ncbi:MAG: hypothetical protein PHV20_09270 [Bacteroidales bacterium]|nr:hypothetical protein [Bacteroidales bacterium]
MRTVFEYLAANCFGVDSIFRVQQQDLWFDLKNIQIIVQFSELNNENFEESFINISEIDFALLETLQIDRIFIQKSNSLYEDMEEDKMKEYLDNYKPLTYQMYKVIEKLRHIFPDSITDFSIKPFCVDDSGSEFGCPDVWNYGFQLNINKSYWADNNFFEYIINHIDIELSNLQIPAFYRTEKNIKDSFELKILNSNTKNRRLGYLKILIKMFNEQSKIPISKINLKFERYCQDYNQFLEEYKNRKGNVVVTKTGYSAKPYIELAINLGLIRKSSGLYEIGKIVKVYNLVKKEIDDTDINPFIFTKFDTTFFLEILLKEDYWFLYSILEQAAITPNISYKNLKKEFKQILLSQIKQFIDEAQIDNSQKVLPLKIIERRINDWKKPEVYMEHVLMPRLNWLYDLELIELKTDLSFRLTEMGSKLLFNLSIWNDIALHKLASPTAYIENYFMKIMDFIFNLQKQRYTKQSDDEFLRYLENSFSLFKTLAPNRITFSLFANHTKQMLFWNNSVMVDTEDIKRAFELKRVPNYTFKYQDHYKDGYIQKNKSI